MTRGLCLVLLLAAKGALAPEGVALTRAESTLAELQQVLATERVNDFETPRVGILVLGPVGGRDDRGIDHVAVSADYVELNISIIMLSTGLCRVA